MTRHTLRLCVAAVMIALSSVSAAQSRAEDAAGGGEAQDEFNHGERAFAAGDYARALRHFQNADRLAPHPAVRFNIAICLDKLGRIREAFELYEKLAADTGLADSARSEARDRAKQAAAALATLQIDGRAGAEAVVDDRDSCRVPCSIKLDPGDHLLRIGGSNQPRRIRLATGETLRVTAPRATKARSSSSRSAPAGKVVAEPSARDRFGTMSYIGGSVAILGFGVFTYFGIRTESLHQEYKEDPNPDTRDRGIQARTTANIALAVGLVGTALIIVDWATSSSSTPSARAPARNSARARHAPRHSAVLAPD